MDAAGRDRGDLARLTLLGLSVLLLAAGCGATPTATATATNPAPTVTSSLGTGSVGHLVIGGAYVPQPASPDVAAAYFTVTNTGDTADALVSVHSDAGATSLHRTVGGAMVALHQLDVLAHSKAALTPGGNHLMIEGLTRPIVMGGSVLLTLTFTYAGVVTVTVPVTGYGGTDAMPSMSGGSDRSGMTGTSP